MDPDVIGGTPETLRPYGFRDSFLGQPDTSNLVAPARIELAPSGCRPDALPLHYGAMAPLERFELPTPRFEAWRSDSSELQGHFGGPLWIMLEIMLWMS